jgi:hypothetical protein
MWKDIRSALERFLAMWLQAKGSPNAAFTSTLSKAHPSINTARQGIQSIQTARSGRQ